MTADRPGREAAVRALADIVANEAADMGRDTPGDEGKDRTQWKEQPTTDVSQRSTITTRFPASTARKPSQDQMATTVLSPTTPSPQGSTASDAVGFATSPRNRAGGEAQTLAARPPEPPDLRAALEGVVRLLDREAEHEGTVRVILRTASEIAAARAALAAADSPQGTEPGLDVARLRRALTKLRGGDFGYDLADAEAIAAEYAEAASAEEDVKP